MATYLYSNSNCEETIPGLQDFYLDYGNKILANVNKAERKTQYDFNLLITELETLSKKNSKDASDAEGLLMDIHNSGLLDHQLPSLLSEEQSYSNEYYTEDTGAW